jgi:hypothetical protein
LHEASHAQQAVQTELKDFNSRSKAYDELEARKQKLEQDIAKSKDLAMCLDKYLDHLNSYHNALQGEIHQDLSVPKEPLPIDILIRNEVSYKHKERNLQQYGFPQMREGGSSQDREKWGRTLQRREKGSSHDIEELERTPPMKGKGIPQDREESNRITSDTWKNGKGFNKVMKQAGREEGVRD